jgi:ferric-dicitrate binding protein FerR (iron transport regulator)
MISYSLRPLGLQMVLYCLKGILSVGMLICLASVESSGSQAKSVGQAVNAVGSILVVRDDGIQESLQGTGSLPLFDGDTLKTEQGNQGSIVFDNGVQVAINEDTEFMIISRWEKDKPLTRILRLKKGELLVKIGKGPKPFEVETPVASARVKETEFDIKVQESGETTLRVIEGIVEFGTPFGTCPIRTATISYGVRGKKCTKPKEENHQTALLWAKDLVK